MDTPDRETDSHVDGMDWRLPLVAGVVAIVVLAVYLPCLDADFVNWDDDKNIVANRSFRGLSPTHLHWMFTTTHMGPYQPLSWLTLGIDYTVWGMRPWGYHLTNILLHAADAAMLFLVSVSILAAVRIRGSVDGVDPAVGTQGPLSLGVIVAGMAAALAWAVHPQHVESVVWVTERRDVLSGLFYLACVWSYLQAHRPEASDSERGRWQTASVACCVMALLSKATTVSIPVVLVILDVYPLRRLSGKPWTWLQQPNRHVLHEKLNYAVLAVLAVVVGFVGQAKSEALRSLDEIGVTERLAIAAHSVFFYVSKTVWPIDLAPLYSRPETIRPLDPPFVYGVLAVAGGTAVVVLLRRRWPAGLAVWTCYIAALLPTSGLITIGDELVADRYSYLPTLSLFVLGGGMLLWLWEISWLGRLRLAWRASLAMGTAALLTVSARQAAGVMVVWQDSLTLWQHVIERRPRSHKAWNNLGGALAKDKRFAEAERVCRRAIELDPDRAAGHHNLGVILTRMNRDAEAEPAFREAIRLNPDHGHAHASLGTVLVWMNKPAEAIEHLKTAMRLDPEGVPNAHFQIGEAYRRLEKFEEAARSYEIAIRMKRSILAPLAGLADVNLSLGRIEQAEEAAQQAVNLRPDRPEGRYALAQVRSRQGRVDQALGLLRKALAKHGFYRYRARIDPHLRMVRTDPRFEQMMSRLPALAPPDDRTPQSNPSTVRGSTSRPDAPAGRAPR